MVTVTVKIKSYRNNVNANVSCYQHQDSEYPNFNDACVSKGG